MEGTDKQKACSSSGVLIFVEDGYWLELTRESEVGLVRGWESSEWRKREKARKREKEKKKKRKGWNANHEKYQRVTTITGTIAPKLQLLFLSSHFLSFPLTQNGGKEKNFTHIDRDIDTQKERGSFIFHFFLLFVFI